jgi:hypothetical protein
MSPAHRNQDALRAQAWELRAMLRVALALVNEGREIDLAGLEDRIGRLCAGVLDLPPEAGRPLRADLIELQEGANTLAEALRARPPT